MVSMRFKALVLAARGLRKFFEEISLIAVRALSSPKQKTFQLLSGRVQVREQSSIDQPLQMQERLEPFLSSATAVLRRSCAWFSAVDLWVKIPVILYLRFDRELDKITLVAFERVFKQSEKNTNF